MQAANSISRQLVVTRVGDAFYGVAIDAVHEIIPVPEITPVPRSPINMLGVINVRGSVVPVADLRGCLGFEPTPFTNDTRIVLVTYHGKKIGLVVDGVSEVTTLPHEAFQSMAGTHGESQLVPCVARFQGAMILVIDYARVLDEGMGQRRKAMVTARPAADPACGAGDEAADG